MLAGEVALARGDVGLPRLLVTAEKRVLAHLPVGVRAEEKWVAQRDVERGPAVPQLGDTWKHRLELAQEGLRETRDDLRIGGVPLERCERNAAARVVDEDARIAVLRPRHVPGVLVARVGVRAAVADSPRPGRVPVPAVELQVKLGVLAVAELRDRGLLAAVEAGRAVGRVRPEDRAQDREGDRHDHAVDDPGGGLAAGLEAQRVGAVGVAHDPGERRVQLHRALCQRRGDRFRQALVPAGDVVPLVRRSEDLEVARVGGEAEQVNQVQRALLGRDVAVLDVVGDVEEAAHRAGVATGHTALDPVIDAHVVEVRAGLRGAAVERGVAGGIDVLLDVVPDRVEVGLRLRVRVVVAEEVVGVGGVQGLGAEEVDPCQVEPARQAEDRLVAAVDQLAAVLAGLPVEPGRGVGVHAAADAARGLVDRRGDARVLQREGRVQARDAAADDCDPALVATMPDGRECGGRAGQRRSADCGAGHLQEVAAREAGPALGADCLHGATRALGFVEVGGQGVQVSQQWSTRHGHSLLRGLPRANSLLAAGRGPHELTTTCRGRVVRASRGSARSRRRGGRRAPRRAR